MRHLGRSRAYSAGMDAADEWWASLPPERKASIWRWVAKPSEETPETLGARPLLDDDGHPLDEALPT